MSTKATPRELFARLAQLKDERSSWLDLWRDCRDYILPDSGNFDGDSARDGEERFGRLIDAEATHDVGVLGAALIGGVSSPARPWLRLITADPKLNESSAVKEWLDKVTRQMLMVFSASEAYSALNQSYLELATYGTAATIVQKHWDPSRVISLQSLTAGEYYLADDPYGRIDTLYREVWMTARQIVRRWDKTAPVEVNQAMETNPYRRFKVYHAIEPRMDRDPSKEDASEMPWRSVYFMRESGGVILSEGGFKSFPALCPRWNATAGSVYGRGPGMAALNVVKRLQKLRVRLHQVLDYRSDPPALIPAQYQGQWDLFKPGGRIPVDPTTAAGVKTAWEVSLDPQIVMSAIQEAKSDIQRFFYIDVFQMLQATADDGRRTATEVQALEQEKMMVMGPVLERLHSELLDPLVETTFQYLVENGQLPEIPDEMKGQPLEIEYISVLQSAQRASTVAGITAYISQVGMLAQLNPNAMDILDVDAAALELADAQGIAPEMIVPEDKVANIRAERQKQQQAQMEAQNAQTNASTLADLSSAAKTSADANMVM